MLALARAFLERKGSLEPRLEAELLVAEALGLERLGLFMRLEAPLSEAEIQRARELLVRRGRREPVAYIIGRREFYGRAFAVGPGVLVPRPETEGIVDRAREWCRQGGCEAPSVLDFGTGSGCLAVTIALEVPGARVTAIEASEAAAGYARSNAERLGAELELLVGSGLEAARSRGPYDLVVSNPPYVSRAELADLEPEVRDHEPPEALLAPEGDLDHWVRRLLEEAPALLRPGGLLLVELGSGQAARALEIAGRLGRAARVHRDLAGIERLLEATL